MTSVGDIIKSYFSVYLTDDIHSSADSVVGTQKHKWFVKMLAKKADKDLIFN